MILVLLPLIVFLFTTTPVLANSIEVDPSILRIDLATEKSQFVLKYTNRTNSPISLTFRAVDFKDLTEGEKIEFVEPSSTLDNKYNLASWLKFERLTLLLDPGETREQLVSIESEKLSGGGHYASVQATIGSEDQTTDNLKLQGILSSIVFVRAKTGNEHEQGQIEQFLLNQNGFGLPTTSSLKFHNLGNVETVPFASVTIFDPFGKTIGRAILNEGSLITLPETIRRYQKEIMYFKNSYLPGNFKAILQVKYGDNLLLSQEKQFFSLGSEPLLLFTVLCVILIITIQIYKKRKVSRN